MAATAKRGQAGMSPLWGLGGTAPYINNSLQIVTIARNVASERRLFKLFSDPAFGIETLTDVKCCSVHYFSSIRQKLKFDEDSFSFA